ncbi:unnamed protein product [Heligmosomoides polygyrus]|uniref:ATG_C domain-containing protein n=1 Tax=Heligmosomoides polygyrus TaxID=6339 RepID=A0A183GHU4_HELPZ|nr:unnamed protein product [Heligmosomoides polygyrus]
MYGINGATASFKGAVIVGKLGDVTNSSIGNSFKDLQVVRKQANRTIAGAICGTALLLPNWIRRTLAPTLRHFLLRYNLIEDFANHSAGYHSFNFHRSAATSSGPVALPGLIFVRATSVSYMVIL